MGALKIITTWEVIIPLQVLPEVGCLVQKIQGARQGIQHAVFGLRIFYVTSSVGFSPLLFKRTIFLALTVLVFPYAWPFLCFVSYMSGFNYAQLFHV